MRRSAALHLSHIANGGDPFELGIVAAARLRPLGGAQARTADRPPAAPRRGGGDRHRARLHLLAACRASCPKPTGGASSICCWRCGSRSTPRSSASTSTTPDAPRSVLRGLAEFREHLGGRLTIMLLRAIGQPFDVHEIDTGRYDPERSRCCRRHRGGASTGAIGPASSIAASSARYRHETVRTARLP